MFLRRQIKNTLSANLWRLLPLLAWAIFVISLFWQTPAVASPASGAPILFEAVLSGAHEVPPVTDSIAYGHAILALDGNTLYYRVIVDDIENVTAAHIHNAPAGSNGSVIFGFPTAPTSGNPISGNTTLTAAQQTELTNGNLYINVHTSQNGGGEIRGQIESFTPPSNFHALLTGQNEVPSVSTNALGLAIFQLSGTTLNYRIDVTEITNITAGHLHMAQKGQNGGVAITLYNGSGTFDPSNPLINTATLSAENLVDLLTGFFYVNIHTSSHSGGEIRGQVGGPSLFDATLTGGQEVPPVTTSATGTAILALSADATTVHYRISVSDIMNITAAHIHQAAAGSNGGVIFTLYSGSGTFDPDNPLSGSFTPSTAQLFDMLGDDYYINIHTSSQPGGEIRGQIDQYTAPEDFQGTLSGDNEVPPVTTSASGKADLNLYPVTNVLQYFISVADITGITNAHIHSGAAGENGSIVFTLFPATRAPQGSSFDPDNPIAGAVTPNSEQLVDLLTTHHYINIHTSVNSGGELRSQITSGQIALAVELASFEATAMSDNILISWQTVSEIDNLGFNLYRSLASTTVGEQLNTELIPSQGAGSGQGFAYEMEDADVTVDTTYYYWLEDVDVNGTTTLHGPISITYQPPTAITMNQVQVVNRTPPVLFVLGSLALIALTSVALVWRRAN